MRWKNVLALIFFLIALCISVDRFINEDQFVSKVWVSLFVIFSLCAIIAVVIDSIKDRNEKKSK